MDRPMNRPTHRQTDCQLDCQDRLSDRRTDGRTALRTDGKIEGWRDTPKTIVLRFIIAGKPPGSTQSSVLCKACNAVSKSMDEYRDPSQGSVQVKKRRRFQDWNNNQPRTALWDSVDSVVSAQGLAAACHRHHHRCHPQTHLVSPFSVSTSLYLSHTKI